MSFRSFLLFLNLAAASVFCFVCFSTFADEFPDGGFPGGESGEMQCFPNDSGGYNCFCCGCNLGGNTNDVIESSNGCVRISVALCNEIKSNVFENASNIYSRCEQSFEVISSITNLLSDMQLDIQSVRNTIFTVQSILYPLFSNISNISSIDFQSVISSLNSSLSTLEYSIDRLSTVELGSGTVVYSNRLSNVAITTAPRLRFYLKIQTSTNYIHECISSLTSIADNVSSNSSAISSALNSSFSLLNDADSVLKLINDEFYIPFLLDQTDEVSSNLLSIQDSSRSLAEYAAMMDCSSCNSSGSSSSPGTVDLSGVVSEIQSLKESMEYWLARLYDLLYNYYNDYNSARSYRASGSFDSSGYTSVGDNWFKRVEYLLYGISGLGNSSNDVSIGSSPSGSSSYEQFVNNASSFSSEQIDSLDSSLSTRSTSLLQSFKRLIDAYDGFRSSYPNSQFSGSSLYASSTVTLSGVQYSVPSIEIGSSADSSFVYIRYGFIILWYLFLAFLAIWVYVRVFSFIVKFMCWFVSVVSSIFGQ